MARLGKSRLNKKTTEPKFSRRECGKVFLSSLLYHERGDKSMKKNAMTRLRLKQYCWLKQEIATLDEKILFAESNHLSDTVMTSDKESPYLQHTITITGYGTRDIPRLQKRKRRYVAECDAIEQYIDSIYDSSVRQLFTRRYLEGLTLKQAAAIVGYSERQAIRLINCELS